MSRREHTAEVSAQTVFFYVTTFFNLSFVVV